MFQISYLGVTDFSSIVRTVVDVRDQESLVSHPLSFSRPEALPPPTTSLSPFADDVETLTSGGSAVLGGNTTSGPSGSGVITSLSPSSDFNLLNNIFYEM